MPYQALLESIITYENNKYLELLQKALKKADISFAQQCNKLRLLPKSYDADEILNNEKPDLESLNQTLVNQDYVGFNHLLTQISDEDLAQLYLQASSQMGLHECLLMQIWFYGIHQNKFYEHILHSQDPIALFNTENNVYLSSRLLIDYMQQEKTAIKPSNLPDYLNQFKVDAIDLLQLSLELNKENSLKILMAYLSQDNYDEFVTRIQTLLSESQEFFSNRLLKYLHQYGYIIANNAIAQNEENSALNQIPPYTWLDIYRNYLTDLKDQANFQTVCKIFYNMAQSQQFNFDKMENFQKYQELLNAIQKIQMLPTHRFSSMYFKSYFYQFMRQTQFKYSPVKLIPWAPVANSIQMMLDVLMPIGLTGYGVQIIYQGWLEWTASLAGSPMKYLGGFGLTVLALIYFTMHVLILRGQITNANEFQIRAFNEIIDHLNALHLFEYPDISKNMMLGELWNVIQQLKAEVELDPDVFKPNKNKFFSQYQSQLMFKGGEQLKPNNKKNSLEKALEEENTEIVINISDEDVNEKTYLLAYKY